LIDAVKLGLILGGAIIVAAAIWTYFSPFHTCIRAMVAAGSSETQATATCAANSR
jgi:hypothetical protein